MSQPSYPTQHTDEVRAAFPMPQFMPRTRREIHSTDAINARQFEHWQTAGRHGTYNRPDIHQQVPFYDVMPNTSRTTDRSYRSQPRFDPDVERGGQQDYFMKYDTTSDSRNMTRELRASVYEDKNNGYQRESNSIMERNIEHRWLLPVAPVQQANVVEELRPKVDDIRVVYRPPSTQK
jgi:hypothetical protein